MLTAMNGEYGEQITKFTVKCFSALDDDNKEYFIKNIDAIKNNSCHKKSLDSKNILNLFENKRLTLKEYLEISDEFITWVASLETNIFRQLKDFAENNQITFSMIFNQYRYHINNVLITKKFVLNLDNKEAIKNCFKLDIKTISKNISPILYKQFVYKNDTSKEDIKNENQKTKQKKFQDVKIQFNFFKQKNNGITNKSDVNVDKNIANTKTYKILIL